MNETGLATLGQARYWYLGDKLTDPALCGAACDPVRRADGKVVVGAGKALVRFESGQVAAVIRRRLRLQVKP